MLPIPKYLEEVLLDTLNYIISVFLYLSSRGNIWVKTSKPNLKKCIVEELNNKIKTLF